MSEIEEVLASSLISIHTPKEWMVNLFLTLKGDEEEMFSLIKWIYDNNPTFDQMIDGWFIDYLKRRQRS